MKIYDKTKILKRNKRYKIQERCCNKALQLMVQLFQQMMGRRQYVDDDDDDDDLKCALE